MPMFTFRPALTLRGRAFKGLRGWAGKPLHPPLTDIPVGAYILAAVFDLISFVVGDGGLATDLWRAGTFVLIGGVVAGVFAAVTGAMDWWRSTPKGTQARRTVNAHGITMVALTAVVVVAIVLRLTTYGDAAATPALPLLLSIVAAVLTSIGGALGGALVYDYGFNVETSGDHPVWHESDRDLMPGEKPGAQT